MRPTDHNKPGPPQWAPGSEETMSRPYVYPWWRSRHQRENRGPRSRNCAGGLRFKAESREGQVMKEIFVSYAALGGYSGLTQLCGLNFFQLAPDHRALWLIGAVVVLGVICRVRRQRGCC